MAKNEKAIQEDKGALAVIAEANEQLKPKKQVARITMSSIGDSDYDFEGGYIRKVVTVDDIIGYSGAENWFVIQKKNGVLVFNRDEVHSVEVEYKDVE